MTPQEFRASDNFESAVRDHYGARLYSIFVFASWAHGDNDEDSDVDVAGVLEDGRWESWVEQRILSDNTLDAVMAAEFLIHCWPISHASWEDATKDRNRFLIEAAKQGARPIASAA
jgi:predicted nucleotidyltransferase